ncbi:putative peptide transporter permease subunit: membrane component of ABC superfamily [Candidatus Desulfosporosinus infrequens]|uniref:Putative peptide transporter permease subunit: membrane component of ABC superfamily n=1 Tax=Candidatus Desulfosporosinus infrequens TaxID=2043169 RepID=A0A2U3JZY4_9FIRM|nr:putative peptide transporter permease subunit: membrane component of ABC superfamily [Candidatus Desulfosporosinus infrequens]
MLNYIIRRTVWTIVTLFFVVLIAFLINFVVPGNPARTIAGPKASPQVIKVIEEKYGLDQPLYKQFGMYLDRLVVHGDLGMSYRTNEEVSSELANRVPKTIYLGLTIFLLNVLIGVPMGIYAAIKRSKFADHLILISSLIGTSAPTFWIGYILLFIFGYKLNLLPIGGYGGLSHVILPAITVSLASSAGYVRVVRTSMLEVTGSDYVRTARAKGLPERTVIIKHAFRSALIPLITFAGMDLASLMGGLIVTEGIFGWPGIGSMAVTAIGYQDMPTIMGTVLVGAVAVVIANFVVDIIYAFVDPRISY